MAYELMTGRPVVDVETPALLLDLNSAEANIRTMATFFSNQPCKVRPHIKTHKLPLLARRQMAEGAIGITCSKLSEAEIFFAHGLPDVLISNQVVEPTKIRRLVHLSTFGRLTVCVDDLSNARELSEAALRLGTTINVLVEVNVGLNRCGVLPGKATLEIVQHLMDLKGITFRGLMGYEGGLYHSDPVDKANRCRECNSLLVNTKDLLLSVGLPVEIVSAGGSNTYKLTGTCPGITDVQPGSYVTMDTHNIDAGLTEFEIALSILATVVSRPAKRMAIVDAGLKALSTDAGLPKAKAPGIKFIRLYEEHGHIELNDEECDIKVGDKVVIIPSHGCTTIPLHNRYVLVRDGTVVGATRIEARGALE
jgi:D-serine deaminase-like pyridoxal phosphate-dependent protein